MRGATVAILFAAVIFIASALFPAAAQLAVEDEIVTGDVNLFDVKAGGNQRSIALAMGLSVVLPGMGHYYVDKPVSAWTYLSIDLASIFGSIVFFGLANQRESDARSYAAMYAGIEKPVPGEAYWRHVGVYMDAAEYNDIIELSRNNVVAGQVLDPLSWWRWGDESQQDKYNDIRQKARNMRVVSSFFVGALVANRIISAVDLRVFHRKGLSSGVRFEPAFAPDMSSASMLLRAEF